MGADAMHPTERGRAMARAWAAAEPDLVRALPETIRPDRFLAAARQVIAAPELATVEPQALMAALVTAAGDALLPVHGRIVPVGAAAEWVPSPGALLMMLTRCADDMGVQHDTVRDGDEWRVFFASSGEVAQVIHYRSSAAADAAPTAVWARGSIRSGAGGRWHVVLTREGALAEAARYLRLPVPEPEDTVLRRVALIRLAEVMDLPAEWLPVRRLRAVIGRIWEAAR